MRRARGFTLLELMVVVAVIGMCAAIASPSFINTIRDSRVSKAALETSDMYRLARTRAMGRGAAVLVRWTQSGGVSGVGLLEVREALTPGAVTPLPSSSCATTDWTNASLTSRHILNFDFGTGAYSQAQVLYFDEVSNSQQTFSEICFTPRGRTYVRYAAGALFAPLTGVPHFTVTNMRSFRVRSVFIPPNGAARVAL